MAANSRSTSRSARSRTSHAASENSLEGTQVAEAVLVPESAGARTNRRRTSASESDISNFTGAVSLASGGASTAANNPGRDPLQEADPWQIGRAAQNNSRPAQRKLEMNPDLIKSLAERFECTAILVSEVCSDWTLSAQCERATDPPAYIADPEFVSSWRDGLDFGDVLAHLDSSVHHPGRIGGEKESVLLFRTPAWTKGQFAKFATLIEHKWLWRASTFSLVSISLIPDVPGNWTVWQHICPSEYLRTKLAPYIRSIELLDIQVVNRLHGANNPRGWDPRPQRCLVTYLTPQMRAGELVATLSLFKKPSFSLEEFMTESAPELLLIDVPDFSIGYTKTIHSYIRMTLCNQVNLLDDALQSGRRPSPGSSRTCRRVVHTFVLPPGALCLELCWIIKMSISNYVSTEGTVAPEHVVIGADSILAGGNIFLLRASSNGALCEALSMCVTLAACLISPTTAAFVVELATETGLSNLLTNFVPTEGTILQLLLGSTSQVLWPHFTAGRRLPDQVADTLRIVGEPTFWSTTQFGALSRLLNRHGYAVGTLTFDRPKREDGSLLDSCRLRTSSASTVNHLALLGSIVIVDLRRAAVEIKFETINERFDWRLPEGSDWNIICSVDLAQTATRSQDEAGAEQ